MKQILAPRSLFDAFFLSEKKQKNILDAQVAAFKVQAQTGENLAMPWEGEETAMRAPTPRPQVPPTGGETGFGWKQAAEIFGGLATVGGAVWAVTRLLSK